MICWKCGNDTTEQNVTIISNWKGYKVTIEGMKAEVCTKCGEKTYDSNDIKLIHSISEGIKNNVKEEDLPEILNLGEVAKFLKVSNQTIYNMIKSGKIPAKKIGKKWVFLKNEIEKLLIPVKDENFQLAARSDGQDFLTNEELDLIKKI